MRAIARVFLVLAAGVLLSAACAPVDPAPEAPQAPAAEAPEPQTPPAAEPFDQTLELQGISFHVSAPNSAAGNAVTIDPTGLEIDDEPVTREVAGVVTGAEIEDLNADGSPDIFVYTRSDDGRAGLVAYASNNRRSLSEIYLPPLDSDPALAEGYDGGDDFALVELRLVRRFPLVRDGEPTGTLRQIAYRLEPGEAGWVLVVDEGNVMELPVPEQ